MQYGADPAEVDGDLELRTRIAEGDHIAFRSLVERYLDRMLALSFRLIGDQSLSERLVEDAMLEIWKIGAGWAAQHEPISYWLYRRIVRGSLGLATIAPKSQKVSAGNGDLDADEVLAQFPLVQRVALMLLLREHLPTRQIAEILQTDEPSVEVLIKTGRRHMRRALRTGTDKDYA